MKTCLAVLCILLGLCVITAASATLYAESSPHTARSLYAVNEAAGDRGSISIYDIDAGHRLIKKISTVSGVADVRGVAVSAVTGSQSGMVSFSISQPGKTIRPTTLTS